MVPRPRNHSHHHSPSNPLTPEGALHGTPRHARARARAWWGGAGAGVSPAPSAGERAGAETVEAVVTFGDGGTPGGDAAILTESGSKGSKISM